MNNISQAQSRLDVAKATRDAHLAQVAELQSCIEGEYGAREETVSSMAIKEHPMTLRTGDQDGFSTEADAAKERTGSPRDGAQRVWRFEPCENRGDATSCVSGQGGDAAVDRCVLDVRARHG